MQKNIVSVKGMMRIYIKLCENNDNLVNFGLYLLYY